MMKLRQVVVLGLVAVAMVGCKKHKPATGPITRPPAADTAAARRRAEEAARQERLRQERERARADSVARDEQTRARVREQLSEMVFFEYDSFDLTQDAEEKLRAKAEILRANPSIRLRIEGHADQRGSTEYNLALGQRRAEAVRTFLEGYGIEAGRLATISYGKERPLVEGTEESAWARNRRAEFVVTGGGASPREQ